MRRRLGLVGFEGLDERSGLGGGLVPNVLFGFVEHAIE